MKSVSPGYVVLTGLLMLMACPGQAEDWPQWRGPKRDAVSTEKGLLKKWPEGGPKLVWQVDNAGVGYSSLAVQGDRVLSQGDLDGVEHVIAWSVKDGSVLWAVQPDPVAKELEKRVGEQFANFDKDEDGKLDESEALAALGWDFQKFDAEIPDGDKEAIARTRVQALLKSFDKDADGKLAFSEVPGAMQRQFERIDQEDKDIDGLVLAENRAKELLSKDEDLDGKLDRKELRGTAVERQFDRIDEKVEGSDKGDGFLTTDELKAYFFAKEPGRDGVLTAKELDAFYLREFPNRDGVLTKADLRRFYGGYRNSYGDGPRGTPTIDGDRVYAEGGNGDLTCLDLKTGETIWYLNLSKDLGGGRPGWGYCESPLVVGELLIVTPGGKDGTLAALKKTTGEVVWRSSGTTQPAHYASPQITEIGGIPQIVQFSRESVYGVTLQDGRELWSYSGANNGTANIATPIISGDFVLASSSYGKGAGLVKITTPSPMEQKADEVYFEKKLANHHGGLVKVGDYVYGFGGALVCMNFLTGEIAWQNRSVGKGSLVYADGMLYCLGENYEVGLVEATPDEYREHGRFKIEAFGRPAWAHPVVANGKLYLRNMQRLAAYDIKAD